MKEMPLSYEDFYTEWAPKFRTAVRGLGCFNECDVDDIVHDLMAEFVSGMDKRGRIKPALKNVNLGKMGEDGKPLRAKYVPIKGEFLTGGYLPRYDPARGEFSTFVWNFVKPRLLGIRKKKGKLAFREMPMMVSNASGEGDDEVEIDYPDPNNEIESWGSFKDAHAVYDKLQSATSDRKYAELFLAMLKQLSTRDNIDKCELAEQFGVSKRMISIWIRGLSEKRAVLEWAVIHKGKTGVFPDDSGYGVWFDGRFVGSAKTLYHANWKLRAVLLRSWGTSKGLTKHDKRGKMV